MQSASSGGGEIPASVSRHCILSCGIGGMEGGPLCQVPAVLPDHKADEQHLEPRKTKARPSAHRYRCCACRWRRMQESGISWRKEWHKSKGQQLGKWPGNTGTRSGMGRRLLLDYFFDSCHSLPFPTCPDVIICEHTSSLCPHSQVRLAVGSNAASVSQPTGHPQHLICGRPQVDSSPSGRQGSLARVKCCMT